jgi:fluoroquinolone resistance protein
MEEAFVENKTYEKPDFKESLFPRGEYDNCTFNNCDFSKANFSLSRFIDCTFLNCNLSLVRLGETIFRDAKFFGCKMLGLLFNDCNKFGLSFAFDNCTLNHSSFFQTRIKKTIFKNSELQEVDWTGCDLTGSVFSHCDLKDAKFENTILEKVDFRNSFNYSIDPEMNRIKKARFSLTGIAGLLDKYDIQIEN